MKKSIKIKASGHVVERKIIDKLIDLVLRSSTGDIRDMHISIPTVAGGVGEKWTSFISFYLLADKEYLHELYNSVMDLLEANEFTLLEVSGNDHNW